MDATGKSSSSRRHQAASGSTESKHLARCQAIALQQQRPCGFLCGRTSASEDPGGKDLGASGGEKKLVPWEYPPYEDGQVQGNGCLYCGRVYVKNYKTVNESRAAFIDRLSKDADLHATFREDTDKFIAAKKEGKRHVWREPVQAQITNTRVAEVKLVRPQDWFQPLDRYKKVCGKKGLDWKKELRDKGHKVTVVQGIKGICMSGDDGETPWKLERSYATQHKRDEVVLDADAADMSGEELENRFEEMQKETDQALDKRMVG